MQLPSALDNSTLFKGRQRDIERIRIDRYRDPEQWVELRINPTRISVQSRKVIQQVQTNTRWVFQHWGMEPYTIQYSGVTGYIQSLTREVGIDITRPVIPEAIDNYDVRDFGRELDIPRFDTSISPYETPAYQALQKLRLFYLEPHEYLQGRDLTRINGSDIDEQLSKLLLRFHYRESLYIGYFMRMEIREEETSPWMWSYDMEFNAYDAKLKSVRNQAVNMTSIVRRWIAAGHKEPIDAPLSKTWNEHIQTSGRELERAVDQAHNVIYTNPI